MVNLNWRPFTFKEMAFFESVVEDSPAWQTVELNGKALSNFIGEWQSIGEWRIWDIEGELAGITFHLETAPSNGKPWLGTMLVKNSMREKGAAHSMIHSLSQELKDKGSSVLFTGIPIAQNTWAEFLSRCGFEQFKTETSEEGTYLILIRPL
ncbi:GNAT family N-acetyltransferase [Mesobacillus foraminis]|uniref:Acetyltransferase (GNAT) family protein n=1 Tax=Mesobacillus foraminis TaxID=279826 RepID=A0A4R2BIL0_9BACI|nr:GNAT family N-acetyltransferase [Mesobacillus foraminis]TCN25764.1 hypothetical protein EV146_105427 [Mesobacillus foraminis]